MSIVTLEELANKIGSQYKVAEKFKVSQGTIQQSISSKRNIFVMTDEKGVETVFEIKPLFKTKPKLKRVIDAIKGLSFEKK